MSDATRYEGRPFLRLLECFVLQAIGELTDDNRRTLTQMTPKLREVYKRDGSWDEIVAAVMEFPPQLPVKIEALWTKNSAAARNNGETLAPEDFARMFVDRNFPTMLES